MYVLLHNGGKTPVLENRDCGYSEVLLAGASTDPLLGQALFSSVHSLLGCGCKQSKDLLSDEVSWVNCCKVVRLGVSSELCQRFKAIKFRANSCTGLGCDTVLEETTCSGFHYVKGYVFQ